MYTFFSAFPYVGVTDDHCDSRCLALHLISAGHRYRHCGTSAAGVASIVRGYRERPGNSSLKPLVAPFVAAACYDRVWVR